MKVHYDMPNTPRETESAHESEADKLVRYLRRSVNGVCYAAKEEQLAAQLICSLQQQVQHLHSQTNSQTPISECTHLVAKIQELTTNYLTLKLQYDDLLEDHQCDGRRIAFCLQETVCASGDMLFADLEQEPVVKGDYRAAIDRLMSN